ncbi:hypothetical protein I6J71_18170 [Amycolatopsis sp. FDAARGOS 1241]|nr:hypothetical protein I6J71_18170 [Amycolatopsis sp. FDAARGOS 1241]
MLLYSDGIIERRGRASATATVELAQVATHSVAGRDSSTLLCPPWIDSVRRSSNCWCLRPGRATTSPSSPRSV